MARDAQTKKDRPSEQEGRGTPAKEELETQQAAEAVGQEEAGTTSSGDPGRAGAKAGEAAEEKPKRKRKPATKNAEGTAAEATGVDKEGAEAALTEGSTEAPAAPQKPRKAAAKKKTPTKKAGDEKAAPKKRAARKTAVETTEPEVEADADAGTAEAEKPETERTKEKAKAAAPRPGRRRDRREPAPAVAVRAQARFVRTSARKARLVADHVRGKDVEKARAILAFSPRSVAEDWRKLLESAVANAEHNHDLVGDDLRVLNATADEGPTLKRFRPRAMGRATRIRKRTSHLTITLTPKETRN
jgi:ribosomal protein L22